MPYRALVGSSRVRSYQPSARNTPGHVPSARLPQRLADETDSFGFENEATLKGRAPSEEARERSESLARFNQPLEKAEERSLEKRQLGKRQPRTGRLPSCHSFSVSGTGIDRKFKFIWHSDDDFREGWDAKQRQVV